MIDSRTAPYATFVLRIALGTMFVAHSLLLKHFTYTLPGTVQFFESLGRGVLLLVGLGSRWVSLALLPVLAGALWFHAGNGWVFSAPNGGWEYPLFLTVASLVQALLGDGRYALSRILNTRKLQGAYA